MPYDYNIPFGGYGQLRYDPQMQSQSMAMQPPDIANTFLKNGMMNTTPPGGSQAGSNPGYTMDSKWQFGLNYQHIAASQAVQGVGAWLRQMNQGRDFKNYNKVANNPIYQLPYNPNTSHQALYGDTQYRRGGMYDVGGPGPGDPTTTPQPIRVGSDDSKKVDLSDSISYNITNMGKDPEYRGALLKQATEQYGPEVGRKLFTSIDVYNQRSDRKNYSGDAAINNFYSLNDNDKDIQNIKNQYKTFAGSPTLLYQHSPFIKGTNNDGSFKYLAQQAMGGPTSSKAKEMLRDGAAQGHPLTDKQKGFFGWIAGGKKAEGGYSDDLTQDDFEDLQDEVEQLKGQINAGTKTSTQTEEEQPETEIPSPEDDNSSTGKETGKNNWAEFAQNMSKDSEWNPSEDDEEDGNPGDVQSPGPVSPGGMMPDMSSHPLLQGFKNGIAESEHAGYTTPANDPKSTAFGKYQFNAPTRENVRESYFPNIKKDDFEYAYKNDPQFQERVMDVYGGHLLQQYGNNVHEAAAAFFLGPGKASMYNQPNYRPTPSNSTVGEYMSQFDKGFNQKFKEGGTYELTNGQIANLKKQGYQVQIID